MELRGQREGHVERTLRQWEEHDIANWGKKKIKKNRKIENVTKISALNKIEQRNGIKQPCKMKVKINGYKMLCWASARTSRTNMAKIS